MIVVRPSEQGSIGYVYLLTCVAALGGLLFGYDTAVISGAIGFLQQHFQLDPQLWKGWAAASALVGCAAGAGLAGWLSDRLGRRSVLILAALLFLISALGTAFPRGFHEFVLFRIIGGLGIGAASLTSPMYIAEVSPARIRGKLVSLNQLAIVSGMVIVYFVNYFIAGVGLEADRQALPSTRAPLAIRWSDPALKQTVALLAPSVTSEAIDAFLAGRTGTVELPKLIEFLAANKVQAEPATVERWLRGQTPWNVDRGWRWMFGSGVIPSILLLVLLFLVPESPRWLAEKGRGNAALAVLTRLSGGVQAKSELADIEATIAQESGSLAQLIEPGMRAVLVIGVSLAVLQQVTGINVFLYYAPEIFRKMGSGVNAALLETLLVGAVNMLFTVVAIWTVDRLGRKPLMLIGATGMGLSLLAMGLAAYTQRTDVWVLLFILGYIACFALSVGPVTWVILAEIFPTRIRGRAMALATVCLWTANFIVTQTFTMMDENLWLTERFHHAFAFWLYAALCVVQVLFVARWVPETKGKTLEEIERGWLDRARERNS